MTWVALGYLLVGLAIPLLLGRTRRERLFALAAMVPTVALGGVGFFAFTRLQELLFL